MTNSQTPAFRSTPLLLLAIIIGLASSTQSASAQLRIVDYNVAQLNGNLTALAAVIQALGVDDKLGWTVPVSAFVFQEVQSADLTPLQNILNANSPPGVSYTAATYTSGPGEDGSAGAQAIFYRNGVLTEITSAHLDIATGSGRNADRWRLRLLYSPGVPWNATPGADDTFYVYGMHLPASNTAQDAMERATAVTAIRNNAATLGSAAHIIYTGDMNFYLNTEQGYQNWILGGTSQAFDPLGTGAWTGAGNAIKQTQSPCATGCSLVNGGMDDRFDFQLSNAQFNDFDGLQLVSGAYRSFGNDGLHYNLDINSPANQYYPTNLPRSNTLAGNLKIASDHIPVIVEYRLPAAMFASLTEDFGRVIQNAEVYVTLSVQNSTPVVTSVGGDILDYSAEGSGLLADAFVSNSLVALSAADVHQLQLDTSVVGNGEGDLTLTSTSEGCRDANQFLSTSGTVLRHSNPSFSNSSTLTSTTVSQSFDPDTGRQSINVPIYNFNFDFLQAKLDIDSVSGRTAPFSYLGGAALNIGASPATLNFSINTDGLSAGLHSANVTINTSDENIPGAIPAVLNLTIDVTINSTAEPCTADIAPPGGNDAVNISDLTAIILAWGTNDPAADIAPPGGDGTVNILDLTEVILAWGACP